ncbi:hypothetical protein DFH09DRAFT_1037028 [Mycena vulgaris]|nr:hypothetical protein DFH09DRAFT_1037028 [Mycena vulgaris]
MSLGMKRGFLGNKKAPKTPPVEAKPTSVENLSDAHRANFQLSETCRTYSEAPRIIEADYRHGQAPEASHFLYLPPKDATIVFVDHLDNIQQISRWDVWQKPAPSPPPDPPFILEQSSSKGMKMVARRSIEQGELIAAERPIYVGRMDIAIAEDQSTTGIFYRAALSGLSPATRSTIMSLCNSFGSEQEPIVGTLDTNCCAIPLAPSGNAIPDQYSGLFPTLCRANHDCSPNANFFFNPRSFTGQFHAVRSIAKDEEITVLYTELAASREERRAQLQEHYKFLCECKTCSLPPTLARQSDIRRRAIGDLIPLMHQGVYAEGMSVARMEELLGWAEDEGLYALYAELLVYGYGLARDVSDVAHKWSRMAAAAFKILDGADSTRFN